MMQLKLIILLNIVLPLVSISQNLEQLKTKYAGENAIILNASIHYNIKLKDGKPVVESKEISKIMYMTPNAATLMSGYGFFHSGFHEIREYEAYTQTTSSKKIRVTDFKTTSSVSKSVFYDDVKETNFNFPSISEGAIGTLEVSMLHKNPYLLSPHYFARYIPVVSSELTINASKDIGLKYLLKGLDTSIIKVSKEEKRDSYTYRFRVSDQPAERPYSDAPDNSWYSPHVVFYIDHYKNTKNERVDFLSSVNNLFELNKSFLKDLNKIAGPELKKLTDSLTADQATDIGKVKSIYQWVQRHIKYIAFEDGMGGFIPRDPNFVCSKRYGDCKDMSSILTTMINTAGIPAYYTWIGTRKIPYAYKETPLPIVDNHMICTVRIDEEWIFLDGTDTYGYFGTPPQGIQDKEALILINDSTYDIVKVPIVPKNKNTIIDTTFIELSETGVQGKINRYLTGYPANDIRAMIDYSREIDLDKKISSVVNRGSNKFKLLNHSQEFIKEANQLQLSASFSLEDYAKKAGDEWYLNLNLFKFYEHMEIDFPKRTMPKEFDFLYTSQYVTVLTIPTGYKVSYLPKDKEYHNDIWGFNISYKQLNNTIILTQEFSNSHLLLYKENFSDWNEVLKHLFPLYKETINLSKI